MDSETNKTKEKLIRDLRRKSISDKLVLLQALESKHILVSSVTKRYYQSIIKDLDFEAVSKFIISEIYKEFIFLVEIDRLSNEEKTIKLEELGKSNSDDKYNSILLSYITDSNDYIKEGAIYGLSYHMSDEIVYNRMKEALNDEFISPLIKEIIRETIQTEDEIRNGK